MERTALQYVTGVSPFGPIFSKELRVTARRKRTYVLRTLYLVALFLVLLLAWTGSRSYGVGVAAQTQLMAELGMNFYRGFLIFSVVAMAVIGPVLTSTAISSERLSKTLNVLLMTPINAWQIVAGKLMSRVWIALTLLGLSLPVLALVRLLGGVELDQMIGAVALATVVALHSAAMGLFFSTLVNRAYIAILLSYATILFLEGFIPFVLIAGFDMGRNPTTIQSLANFNWFFCMGMMFEGRFFRGVGWTNCALVHLTVGALFLLASGRMLRKLSRTSGEQPATVDPSSYIPIAAALAAMPSSLDLPTRLNAPPPLPAAAEMPAHVIAYAPRSTKSIRHTAIREVSDNPILWREVRRPLTTKRWQMIVFGGGCITLLLIAYAVLGNDGDLGRRDSHIGFAIIFNGLIWLLISVISATAIAQEKESDTWTLLMTTPLSGTQIVWAKVMGLLRRMMWPYLLVLGHFTLFTLTGVVPIGATLLVMWVMFSFNMIWVATGVYLSLRLRKVTTAVILNLLLAVIAYPLVALLLQVAGETLMRHQGSASTEQVGWYLPYSYLVQGIERIDRGNSRDLWLPRNLFTGRVNDGSYYGYYGYHSVSEAEYLAVVFTVGIVYLGAAALLIQWTAMRFDSLVHRSPQLGALPYRKPPQAPPNDPLDHVQVV